MWTIKQAEGLQSLLAPVSERGGSFTCAVRLTGVSPAVEEELRQLLRKAKDTGSLAEGRLANPDTRETAAVTAAVGQVTALPGPDAAREQLERWLPGLRPPVCADLASALCEELDALRRSGKLESALRNAWIKLLWWLKSTALGALQRVGAGVAPKVALCGQAGVYELAFLCAVSRAGCDSLLLDLSGQARPGRLQDLTFPGQKAFGPDFAVAAFLSAGADAPRPAAAQPPAAGRPLGAPLGAPLGRPQVNRPQTGQPQTNRPQMNRPQQVNPPQASQPQASGFHFSMGSGASQPIRPQETQPQAAQPQASQPQASGFHFSMGGGASQPIRPKESQPQAAQPQASQPQASGFHFSMGGSASQPIRPQESQPQAAPPQASQPQASGFHFSMGSGASQPIRPQESQPQAAPPQASQPQASGFHFSMGGSASQPIRPQESQPQAAPPQASQPQAAGGNFHFQLKSPKQAGPEESASGGPKPINLTRGEGRVGAVPVQPAGAWTQGGSARRADRAQGLICTNAWLAPEDALDAIARPPVKRGDNPSLLCNLLVRFVGCEDPTTYEAELLGIATRLRADGRKVLALDQGLDTPTADEIAQVRRRGMYPDPVRAVEELSGNLQAGASLELQRMLTAAFLEVMGAEARRPDARAGVIVNTAVHLICWFRRYQAQLFSGWKRPAISCVFVVGGARNEKEALFYRMLARLPADVVLLCPDGHIDCTEDPLLYEKHFDSLCSLDAFPREGGSVRTAARRAEGVIQTLLHQDPGMYLDRQFTKAQSVTLHSTAEEIALYWNQELQYRPTFSTAGGIVTMPVLFAKVSGVPNPRKLLPYWQDIKRLMDKNTYVITSFPHIRRTDANPIAPHAASFLAGGRLQREKIRTSRVYQYGLLRQEMEEFLLDKLQLMLDERLIQGTFQNGTEYTVVSVCLNLGKELRRLLQEFNNFATANPKLLGVFCGDEPPSQEDAILCCYLSLLGFDVVIYAPTGYQCIERWYTRPLVDEHQAGEYVYDLRVPDFKTIPDNTLKNMLDRIRRRN